MEGLLYKSLRSQVSSLKSKYIFHISFLISHLSFGKINLEVQQRPEGPLANSHAREGVEQTIKLILRSEGPADDWGLK